MRIGKSLFTIAVALVIGVSTMAAGGPVQHTTGVIKTHPSQGPVQVVEGAWAKLVTNDSGASMIFHTSQLVPGNAYTAWWVIINNPAACLTSPCTSTDILFRTAMVQAEVTYAAGHVIGGSGEGAFAGRLAVGEVPGGWFGNEFTNPRGAEIHVIINDHGPMIHELVANQISTYRGGCTDASLPPAFPATAKADGVPGPNTCRLFQFTIFQQ